MKPVSIKAKLVGAILLSLATVAVATALFVLRASERNVGLVATEVVQRAGRALDVLERADVERLEATLAALRSNPALRDAFAARDRERLAAVAAPIFDELRRGHDITHWYFIDAASRTTFLRVHRPELFGDAVSRATLEQAIASGRGAGKELGQTAFALRVVAPWTIDGRLAGYVELGEEIDHFLGRLERQTGDDYALVVEKRFLDEGAYAATRAGRRNDWGDLPDRVVVNATAGAAALVRVAPASAALPPEGALVERVREGGRMLARGAVPVTDATGRRVGVLLVQHDITALYETLVAARARVLAAVAVLAAVLAAALLWLVERLVFARLGAVIATLEDVSARLAGGDYDVQAPAPARADELGRLEQFFGKFIAVVAGLLKDLTSERRAG